MSDAPLLEPSFELSVGNSDTRNTTSHGRLFVAAGSALSTTQRVFTRYTSDPGLTQSSSSSPPSSPCSLSAIDSSPPSSPSFVASKAAGDDLDLDMDLDLEDDTVNARFGQARTRCMTPELGERTMQSPGRVEGDNNAGKRKAARDDLQTSPAHPFSASTRGVKRPPMYDKSTSRAKVRRKNLSFESAGGDETSPGSSQSSGAGACRRHSPKLGFAIGLRQDPFTALGRPDNLYARDAYLNEGQAGSNRESTSEGPKRSHDPEHVLWEETIAQAVDGAESKIDLSGHNLSYISPSISDLSNVVVFRGANEASPLAGDEKAPPKRTMSRSTTSQVFGASKVGTQEDEIHLFLGNNRISFLPHELFSIDALVVLSLRHNQLTEIPPLISQLRNLRELNVANNRLRYLPSELLSLSLTSLAVDPNPFIENPYSATNPGKERWVGPIERIHRIMPLAELSLRVLLAPVEEDTLHTLRMQSIAFNANWKKTYKSRLEELYGFPIVTELPSSIETLLALCLPGSVPSGRHGIDALSSPLATPTPMTACSSNSRNKRVLSRPCISECPSPMHCLLMSGEVFQRPLFVEHAEERLCWEKEVAGQKVGGEHGVPILWRGCSAGCLEFLDEKESDSSVATSVEEDWDVAGPVPIEAEAETEGLAPVPVALQQPPSIVEDSDMGPPFSSEGFEFEDDD